MLFSGIPFLYFFLPVFLIIYFLIPGRQQELKNLVLFLFSLIFYGWGESKYVILMLAVILLGYVFGILLEYYSEKKGKKYLLLAASASYLLILGYFKYADFFLSNIKNIFRLNLPLLNITLPIGISFYIFQILSYNVDVYRKEVRAQKNLISLGAYVSMFPQLIAGPIVRYKDISCQLQERSHSIDLIYNGIRRFVIGLGKKILLANLLGECCAYFKSSEERDLLFFWIYGISYLLHIYFDFSGYSDMAIGLGRILGFEFMENFRYPYISRSLTEFWRRWHISLGTWFKDYVYIPLGGNRAGKRKWVRNIFVVWLLTGFWHGAAWNFIVWGLYFAFFLILEKKLLLKYLEKRHIASRLYVIFFLMVSFIIFDSPDLFQGMRNIAGLFGIGASGLVSAESIYYGKSYFFVILTAVVGATPLPAIIFNKMKEKAKRKMLFDVAEAAVMMLLLLISTAYLVDGSFNPFLYFRF